MAVANGVDLDKIEALTEQFRRDPDSGRRPYRALVRWLGGYRTESDLENHVVLRGDEPETLAGTDTGPSPEDMLLAAVGQCVAVGYAGSTAAKGLELRRLEIEVRGTVNLTAAYGVEEAHPGFDRIELRIDVDVDLPREELQRLHERVMELAPIPNTVARPIEVDARLA